MKQTGLLLNIAKYRLQSDNAKHCKNN